MQHAHVATATREEPTMRPDRRSGIAALALGAILITPMTALAGQGTQLDHEVLCNPETNVFSTTVDNSYFPLPMGMQWVLAGREQGASIRLQVTVTGETKSFYTGNDRIETIEVEELEWEDANDDGIPQQTELLEISLNYYAQTQDGTVCYFGESVDIYQDGTIVSNAGSWFADEGDNAPGIFMPASPAVGMTFQQEDAEGVAQDTATIVRIGQTLTVPAGTFTNTVKVRDVNPLDGSHGVKVYAPGFGIIRDGPLDLISPSP
jgi:hypothetical protein